MLLLLLMLWNKEKSRKAKQSKQRSVNNGVIISELLYIASQPLNFEHVPKLHLSRSWHLDFEPLQKDLYFSYKIYWDIFAVLWKVKTPCGGWWVWPSEPLRGNVNWNKSGSLFFFHYYYYYVITDPISLSLSHSFGFMSSIECKGWFVRTHFHLHVEMNFVWNTIMKEMKLILSCMFLLFTIMVMGSGGSKNFFQCIH